MIHIPACTTPAFIKGFRYRNTDSREEGGRKSEIPITFGPIHAALEPYFAVSFSIVFHVNLLYTIRKEMQGETRLKSTKVIGNMDHKAQKKATINLSELSNSVKNMKRPCASV